MPASARSEFSELYSAYAAGRLDPALALLLETQSMLRPDVRGALAVSEMVSGMMLERATPAELSDGAKERTLSLIDALVLDDISSPTSTPAVSTDAGLQGLPAPLREPALEALGHRGWQNLVNGIRRVSLDIGSELEVELYRIEPGAHVPRHTHGGQEFTLVVQGGFSDELGSYGPGDLCVKGPADTHQPVGDAGEVCFALAVRDSGLRFTGIMGLAQRILGR